MELENRDQLEAKFASRMARLHGSLRTQLIALLGSPPDPSKVPESFWIEAEAEMQRQLAIVLLLVWGASARQHGLGSDLADVAALRYAEMRSQLVAPQWAANSRSRLTAYLGRGGLTAEQIAADVFSPSRAESLATTETTTATSSGGEVATVQTVGINELDTWYTQDDSRVCPTCGPLHSTPRSKWMARFPDGPPAHTNCILPGAVVQGRIVGGSKAFYAGQAIEFLTASGVRLAVTANHPVLTETGFVPACRVSKGDHLVRYIREGNLPCFVANDKKNIPSTIEKVFCSLSQRSQLKLRANPAAVNFHGDEAFLQGHVDVVLTTRMLLADAFTKANEFTRQSRLVGANVQLPGVTCKGPLALGIRRINTATTSGPCSFELPVNRRRIGLHVGPLDPLLLGSAAKHCAIFEKMLDEAERRAVLESPAVNSGFYRKLIQGLSGVVSPDKVLDVRNFEWRGHVYDLQSMDGWFYSNDIIVHNCRCWIEYAAEKDYA